MFQLLPCSRCQRTFSVRGEVSDAALLKCPNCGNQFRLAEFLDALYAPWQVIEDPGVAGERSASITFASPSPSAVAAGRGSQSGISIDSNDSGRDLEVVEHENWSAEPSRGLSLDGNDGELRLAADSDDDENLAARSSRQAASAEGDKVEVDWSKFKPITHEEYQRMRRSDRSSIWSVLQVVLGGAAAIPVSLLLIWYGLGKDVAGAGPAVARYVPWIVPQQFRGNAATANADSELPGFEFETPASTQDGSRFRNFDRELAQSNGSSAADGTTSGDIASNTSDGLVIAKLKEERSKDAPTSKSAKAEGNTELEPPAPAEAAPQPDDPLGVSGSEVYALLNGVKQKVDNWKEVDSADSSVKKQAAIALFEDLGKLGVLLSMLPDDRGPSERVRDRAQDVSRAIKRQPDLVEVLHNAAKAQLNGNLPRSKDGWALVCTIGEVVNADSVWRVTASDPTLVPLDVPAIEIPKSVVPRVSSGQRLLLLGRFVTPATAADSTGEDADQEAGDAPAPSHAVFRASFSYGL